MYSEKERKKLKGFVSSSVNEWMDLNTFLSKRKKRKKERKKKEKGEKDCWERPLCLTLRAGLIQPIV